MAQYKSNRMGLGGKMMKTLRWRAILKSMGYKKTSFSYYNTKKKRHVVIPDSLKGKVILNRVRLYDID